MDQLLLKRINIVSIILVLLLIIVFAALPDSWPMSLVKALPMLYIFILFFLNIRRSVLDQVGVYKKAGETLDAGKSPLRNIRYWLYFSVIAIIILSSVLLWYIEPVSQIYGILLVMALFLLAFLYLARLIDLSYVAEYFSSKMIRISYASIAVIVVLFIALGAFVFIYLREQFAWYLIGITLLFLLVAAYFRTRKTLNFLRYIKNKPFNSRIEEGLRIFNSLSLLVLIIAYLFYPHFTMNLGSTIMSIDIFALVLRLAVVVNLAKAIMDIS